MRQALPNAAFMGFTGHAAHRRRGADPRAVRRLRLDLQLPRRHRGRRDRPAVLREPDPRAPARQRAASPRSSTSSSKRPSSTTRPKGSSLGGSAREYTLLTRPERLRTIARDLVRHFVGRGFAGKAMYVGDRQGHRRPHVRLRARGSGPSTSRSCAPSTTRFPCSSGPGWQAAIELMETTDMAVVVSQGQNEIAQLRGASASTSARTARGWSPRTWPRSSRMPTTRCGSSSCARCG